MECPVGLDGRTLKVDLMAIDQMEFNLIFTKDWLFNHYGKIDYQKHDIEFEPPNEEKVRYAGTLVKATLK